VSIWLGNTEWVEQLSNDGQAIIIQNHWDAYPDFSTAVRQNDDQQINTYAWPGPQGVADCTEALAETD
jgi:hypothetical protein